MTRFVPNAEQVEFLTDGWHVREIVLKARQIGFSTLFDLLILDAALFNSNTKGAIIADTAKNAGKLFKKNVVRVIQRFRGWRRKPGDSKDLEEWAWPELAHLAHADTERADTVEFPNGSEIYVSTSARGGTLHWLHVSEYGKVSAREPEKAREIKTGAINALVKGGVGIIESTAEGRSGEFFDLVETARRVTDGGVLTPMDWRFRFFSWIDRPEYRLDDPKMIEHVLADAPSELVERRKRWAREFEIEVTDAQFAWYVATERGQRDDMQREYPTVPEEAFEGSLAGAYYAREMAKARKEGRITTVPHDPSYPVNTFWDLAVGAGDAMAIWFHQYVDHRHNFVRFLKGRDAGVSYYWEQMQDLGYTWGRHFWPHDGANRDLITGDERFKAAGRLFGQEPVIVQRNPSRASGIERTRNWFSKAWFDKEGCKDGIVDLDGYRKRWIEALGVFSKEPMENGHQHGADALRTWAEGWTEEDVDDNPFIGMRSPGRSA